MILLDRRLPSRFRVSFPIVFSLSVFVFTPIDRLPFLLVSSLFGRTGFAW